MVKICTARFNKNTLNENVEWRKKTNKLTHCVYGAPSALKQTVKKDEWLIVLEMHNDINRIIGLGLVRNSPLKYNKIYSCGNYNRYTYEGRVRVDLDLTNMNDDSSLASAEAFVLTEEERIVIRMLELSLFYGQTHSKRAKGICELPGRISSLYDFKGCLKGLLLRCSRMNSSN
jgi:hypothetical protein